MQQLFETLLVYPLINILVAFYQALVHLHIPGALGLSIILSTILIRLILYPLTLAQIKTSKKMQEVQPLLNRLKEKYKDDPKRLQQEQMTLFKEQGVNPLAGCLPTIIQIVFLFGFYSAIYKVIALKPSETVAVINKIVYFPALQIGHIWSTSFFGFPIAKTPAQLLPVVGFAILLIPVMTGVLQLIQTKMMSLPASKTPAVKNKPDKKTQPDFAQSLQSQMMYMTPFIIGIVSYQFALGLSLYWNTFTIFGIIQQYYAAGWGGLADWIKKLPWKK